MDVVLLEMDVSPELEVDVSPELAAVEFETVTVSAVVLVSDDVVMTVDAGLVADW